MRTSLYITRVSTGYGQPSSTLFDWTLASSNQEPGYGLPNEIKNRLLIEKFSDKVTRQMYGNVNDPVGLCDEKERPSRRAFLAHDFDSLTNELSTDSSRESFAHILTESFEE